MKRRGGVEADSIFQGLNHMTEVPQLAQKPRAQLLGSVPQIAYGFDTTLKSIQAKARENLIDLPI